MASCKMRGDHHTGEHTHLAETPFSRPQRTLLLCKPPLIGAAGESHGVRLLDAFLHYKTQRPEMPRVPQTWLAVHT